MGIFGQVWLWSSLAFVLGAFLCWLLVALPARRRVLELEAEAATRVRRQPERPADARRRPAEDLEEELNREYARSVVPGLGEEPHDAAPGTLTRSYSEPYEVPMNRGRPDRLDSYEQAPDPYAQALSERSEPLFAGPPSAVPDSGPVAPAEPATARTERVDTPSASATQYLGVSAGALPESSQPLQSPAEVPPSNRGWFDDELQGELADKPPEEQPLTVRRSPMPANPGAATTTGLPIPESGGIQSRLVDDGGDDGEPPAEPQRPRSAIEDDSGGTVFTQRTTPIPGELIRQIDESGPGSLVDDLADEDEPRAEQTVESEPVEAAAGATTAVVDPEPAEAGPPEPDAESDQEQTQIVPTGATESEPAPQEAAETKIMPGVTVKSDSSMSKLPKRVPAKPQSRTPSFGVLPSPEPTRSPAATSASTGATTSAATTTTSTSAALSNEPTRSLFEPIVPAGEGGEVPPPPSKLHDGNGAGGRGPFGPGSAMPLPGGASPSPEFTIKASVAALRYCTPDSPQFGRTVAEVWFRTAADAERVGFRPVG